MEEYSFSVTTYAGHEEDILQMRNRNRPTRRARQYLDWRYLGESSGIAPQAFWMHGETGDPVAMASLIFRPYLVGGKKEYFGVLGDISVNQEHRGEGLATGLFQFLNEQIKSSNYACSFVLPNRSAEKILATVGWKTVGYLVPMVCVVEPVAKFKNFLRVDFLARLASITLRAFTRTLIRLQTRPDISVRVVSEFDADFEKFWESFPKQDLILHDRSLPALNWRYRKQPDKRYNITKFFKNGKFIGYAVSELMETDGMCLVSDFLVADESLVRPCMAAFLRRALQNEKVITVRIVLIEGGAYANQLWKFSFFKREPVTAFQIFRPSDERMNDPAKWFITAGDKDA